MRIAVQFYEHFLALNDLNPGLKACFTGHTHMQYAVEVEAQGAVRVRAEPTIILRPDSASPLGADA